MPRTGTSVVVGVGNLLMGDEGVGVHLVRYLEAQPGGSELTLVDGGTGGLHLLEVMQRAERVILVDATLDGGCPGTIRRLRPRFSSDYPRTLTAHDIGLKDLLDALYMLDHRPDITLLAVSVELPAAPTLELSPEIERILPELSALVLAELRNEHAI